MRAPCPRSRQPYCTTETTGRIEAECLVLLLPASRDVFGRGTAARIKAASYPLALIHYAIGAGALAVLLNRRTARGVGDAAGTVGLISLFDIGIQLLMLILGFAVLETDAAAADVRVGVAIGVASCLGLGFFGLRTRLPLGPLERIRRLSIFGSTPSNSTLPASAADWIGLRGGTYQTIGRVRYSGCSGRASFQSTAIL